jgi:hypothetical protein
VVGRKKVEDSDRSDGHRADLDSEISTDTVRHRTRIYFPCPAVLQYGTRVVVIEVAAAIPHLSTEGSGEVAVKVATPPLMRPATCHVMLPQFPLSIVKEP